MGSIDRTSPFMSIELLLSNEIVNMVNEYCKNILNGISSKKELDIDKYLSLNLELIKNSNYCLDGEDNYWIYYSIINELEQIINKRFIVRYYCNGRKKIFSGYSSIDTSIFIKENYCSSSVIPTDKCVYEPILS